MPINPEALLNYPIPPLRESVPAIRAILYAVSLGLGNDPMDSRQLRYVYEQDLAILPTFPIVLGAFSKWMRDPEIGLNMEKLVHGDQSVRIHRPLKANEDLTAAYEILSISDKGAAKGAIIRAGCKFETAAGELVAQTNNGFFFRGDGGFGGENLPTEPELPVPARAPDIVDETKIPLNAAILYRLTGDMNPLHIEPAFARRAGFERPILHGSCTFGIVARVILDRACDYRPGAIKYIRTRYSAPVIPGETLKTEIWVDDGRLQFRTAVSERNIAVLTGGVAEIG